MKGACAEVQEAGVSGGHPPPWRLSSSSSGLRRGLPDAGHGEDHPGPARVARSN